MTVLSNNFEEGTNGTTVSPANSGGSGSNAFDTVTAAGTCAYDNTHVWRGALAVKMVTASTSTFCAYGASLGAGQTEVWFRLYLFFTANPTTANPRLVAMFNTTTETTLVEAIDMGTTGVLHLETAGAAGTYTIPTNTWTRIEGFVNQAGGTAQIKYFNGDSQTPVKIDNFSTTYTNTIGSVTFGAVGGTASWTSWLDEIGVSTTGFLGAPLYVTPSPGLTCVNQRSKGKRINNDSWIGTKPSFGGQRGGVSPTQNFSTRMHRMGGIRGGITGAVVGGKGISEQHHHGRLRNRAVIGGRSANAGGVQGQVRATLHQSWMVVPPRRKAQRTLVGPFNGLAGGLGGLVQPRPPPQQLLSGVPPRRRSARAVVGNNNACADGQAGQVQVVVTTNPNGTVQPTSSFPCRPRVRTGVRFGGNAPDQPWNGISGPQPGQIGTVPHPYMPPRRYPFRIWVGNDPQPWDASLGPQPGQKGTVPLPYMPPRRKSARTVTTSVRGSTQPAPPARQTPQSAVPPRRTLTRAYVRSGAGAQPGQLGVRQPRPTIAIPRRYPSRVVTRIVSLFILNPGKIQPWPTIATPRRDHRQRAWIGNDPQPWEASLGPQPGQIGHLQPRPTIAIPRRYPSRAGMWEGIAGLVNTSVVVTNPSGTVQPLPTFPVPRRKSARAGQYAKIAGTVAVLTTGTRQPIATRPVEPRRYPSRAVVRGSQPYLGNRSGTVPHPYMPPRRGTARAYVRQSAPFLGYNLGKVQPTATRQPRRGTARAVIAHGPYYAGKVSGTIQPRASVPIPRRSTARAVVRSGAGLIRQTGQTQPRATIAIPRRYPSRLGFWETAQGTARPPTGTRQPLTTRQPRRTTARMVCNVLTNHVAGRAAPPKFNGTIQSRATLPIPRRYPSRAGQWRNSFVSAIGKFVPFIQPVTAQPHRRTAARAVIRTVQTPMIAPTGRPRPQATQIARRATARAVLHTQGSPAGIPKGTVQPVATRQPRRLASRALVQTFQRPTPQRPGKIQARATVPLPRRQSARLGQWHGLLSRVIVASGPVQPLSTRQQPRRASTRVTWLRVISALSHPPGGTQPVATRLPRRTPARALVQTVQSHIVPAAGHPMPRAVVPVPRRTTSRAVVLRRVGPIEALGQPPHGFVARRTSARAVVNRVFNRFVPLGRIQPRPTITPRRTRTRGQFLIGHGVLGVQGRPMPLACRQPRRTASRAVVQVHYKAAALPPAGKPQRLQTRPSRRTSARAVVNRITGKFTLTSTVTLAWDITAGISSTVTIAFNVGTIVADRQGLIPGTPFLQKQVGHPIIPEQPYLSPYDGMRKIAEVPENPAQGGAI